MAIAKVSTAKRKREGDKGSPCLTPRVLKYSEDRPLFIIQL